MLRSPSIFQCLQYYDVFLSGLRFLHKTYLLGTTSSNKVKIAVATMIFGALVAASNDLAFDAKAYSLVFVNDVTTALFGVTLKKQLGGKNSIGKIPLLFYNSMFSIPLLGGLMLTVQSDQFYRLQDFNGWYEDGFYTVFFLSIMMGSVLNYSIFLCTSVNSALTTTIVGCIKNVLIAYLGVLGFVGKDYIFSWPNVIGLNISIFGGFFYAYVKFKENNPDKTNIDKIHMNQRVSEESGALSNDYECDDLIRVNSPAQKI